MVLVLKKCAALSVRVHIVTIEKDGILKFVRSPGIDSKKLIPPAYVARRAGTTSLIPTRFLTSIDCSKFQHSDVGKSLRSWNDPLPPISLQQAVLGLLTVTPICNLQFLMLAEFDRLSSCRG